MKKLQKTITLTEEAWEYLNMTSAIMHRTLSQEIEYLISMVKNKRDKDDSESISMASSGILHQTRQR